MDGDSLRDGMVSQSIGDFTKTNVSFHHGSSGTYANAGIGNHYDVNDAVRGFHDRSIRFDPLSIGALVDSKSVTHEDAVETSRNGVQHG